MRHLCLLLALLLWPGRPAAAQTRSAALLPFVEHGRWGFIDSTGAVAIKPRFAQVQPFSEGLAAVREGELYGYIDHNGRFVVPPQYAYAEPFREGRGLVQQDSIPRLIDQVGRLVPLPAAYRSLEWQPGPSGGLWVGTLPSAKCQLLVPTGKLLHPNSFERIDQVSSNRIVVNGPEPLRDKEGQLLTEAVGVLDGRGQQVIPYYRFSSISAFHNGVAAAALYQPGDAPEPACIIDTTGRILARLPKNQEFADYSRAAFADGVVPVHISKEGSTVNLDNSYPTAVDRQGRVLFQNRRLHYLTSFYRGRAWAQTHDNNWYLLDKTGRRLSAIAVRQPLRAGGFNAAPAFAGGAEVVALAGFAGYAALDSTGRVIRRLATPDFAANPGNQTGDLLPLYEADSLHRLAFWNWRTGLLTKPRFTAIDPAGYQHGLLAVREDNRLGYLAPDGNYVWRESAITSAPLNLDYMRRNFYQVASARQLPRYAGFGGWAPSDNQPKPADLVQAVPQKLTLQVAATATPRAFDSTIDGHRVTIANSTADTVVFDAQDSSLYLTVQAQDAQGRWRNIEYTPSSFCGNSYHQVFLAPGQCWQLTVPAYAGGLKTQLRVKLIRHRTNDLKGEVTLYSNTFAGSVNAAQFWRQQGYSAQGMMDPYTN